MGQKEKKVRVSGTALALHPVWKPRILTVIPPERTCGTGPSVTVLGGHCPHRMLLMRSLLMITMGELGGPSLGDLCPQSNGNWVIDDSSCHSTPEDTRGNVSAPLHHLMTGGFEL